MEQVISKFDAAKRQLDCALELFFAGKDAIPVHTLACAAHQVIYDINRNKKGPELLFDHIDTSDSKIKVTKKTLHSHYNFFKYADNDPCPDCGITFNSEITEIFMLSAIIGIYYLDGNINEIQRAYICFIHLKNPDFLTQDIAAYLKCDIDEPLKSRLKKLERQEFLYEYLKV